MSDPITLAPEDPRLLQAAFEAKYQTPPERARKIHEITDLLYRWDSGRDKTREELRNGVLDTRNLVERQIKEGRTGWEDSALGAMEVLLAVAKPMSTMGGSGAEAWIESVQDLLKSQLVTDLLQDQRSHNSAAATAQLVEDFGDRLDISVQFLAEALVTDQTGTLRQVVTDLFPEVVGQAPLVDPSPGGMVKAHPDLFAGLSLDDDTKVIVQADNSVVIQDIDALRAQLKEQFADATNNVNEGFGVLQGHLKEITEQHAALLGTEQSILIFLQNHQDKVDAIQDAERRKQQIEKAQKEAAATMEAAWAASQGTIVGTAAIVGLFDKKLAGEISKVGSAVLQTAKCAVSFVNSVSALSKGVSALTALGAAAATGNLIGAVIGIVGIFAPSEPSPELLMDRQILAAIDDVQKNLSSIGQAMGRNFALLDSRLNAMYASTMDGLERILNTVNLTYNEVLKISEILIRQQADLLEIHRAQYATVKALEERELRTKINEALDYARRVDSSMRPEAFNNYAASFYTFATSAVFNEIYQSIARGTDNEDLANNLPQGPSDDDANNVSYINAILIAKGCEPIVVPEPGQARPLLPNMQLWRASALALGQLCSEWPLLADTPGMKEWLLQVAAVGNKYQKAIGEAGKDDRAIIAIAQEYTQAVRVWGAAMSEYRSTFQRQELAQILRRDPQDSKSGPVDIFAGSEQQLHHSPPLLPADQSASSLLEIPESVRREISPAMVLSDYLHAPGTSPLQLQWQLVYSTSKSEVSERPRDEEPLGDTWQDWEDRRHGSIHSRPRPEPRRRMTETDQTDLVITMSWKGALFGKKTVRISTCSKVSTKTVVEQWTVQSQGAMGHPSAPFRQFVDASGIWEIAPASMPAVFAAATEMACERLRWARAQYCAYIRLNSSPGGSFHKAALAVEGLRRLLRAYVSLVWPMLRDGDDILHTLFDGPLPPESFRLPDREDILNALSASDFINSSKPELSNVLIEWLKQMTFIPAELLRVRLSQWAAAIRDGSFDNQEPNNRSVLERLALVDALILVHRTSLSPAKDPIIARLQQAVHLPETHVWDAATDMALQRVRQAAKFQLMPDIRALQQSVGTLVDGKWGPNSKLALLTTVRGIQAILQTPTDGLWGPRTESAYAALRERLRDRRHETTGTAVPDSPPRLISSAQESESRDPTSYEVGSETPIETRRPVAEASVGTEGAIEPDNKDSSAGAPSQAPAEQLASNADPIMIPANAEASSPDAQAASAERVGLEPVVVTAMDAASELEHTSLDKAIHEWERIVEQAPQHRASHRGLIRLLRQAEKWMALAAAINDAVNKVDSYSSEEKLEMLFELVEIYKGPLRSDSQAIVTLNSMLAIQPGNVRVIDALAAQFEAIKRWPDLISTLRKKAEQIEPVEEKAAIYNRMARLFQEHFANIREATSMYEQTLALDKENAEAITCLKNNYVTLCAWDKLIALRRRQIARIENAIVRGREFVEVARLASEKLQNPNLSIELWESVLQADSANAEALSALENLYEHEKMWGNLGNVIERRISLLTNNDDKVAALRKLGVVFTSCSRNNERAVRAWRWLLLIDPQDRRAQHELKKLSLEQTPG